MMLAGLAPSVRRDGNVGAFVGHRHHQGADQIEGGNGHDQGQDDEHHALLDLNCSEPGTVLACPVADVQVAGEAAAELVGHLARLVQVTAA
jgi:hypothetical protein